MPHVRNSSWSGRTFTQPERMQAEALLWATNVAGQRQWFCSASWSTPEALHQELEQRLSLLLGDPGMV